MLFMTNQMLLFFSSSFLLDKDMVIPMMGMNFNSSAKESSLLLIPCSPTLLNTNQNVYKCVTLVLSLLEIFLQ